MSYYRNGKKVSRDEFLKHAKGFNFALGAPEIGSFTGFISPIDNSYIVNRQQLSDHCKKHDVIQVGDDLKQSRKENDDD